MKKLKTRNKRLSFKCKCGLEFSRQARYIKNASKPQNCTKCTRSYLKGIRVMPTIKLKEIIELDGYTASGTEYFHYLEEIKAEYYERTYKQMEKMHA